MIVLNIELNKIKINDRSFLREKKIIFLYNLVLYLNIAYTSFFTGNLKARVSNIIKLAIQNI